MKMTGCSHFHKEKWAFPNQISIRSIWQRLKVGRIFRPKHSFKKQALLAQQKMLLSANVEYANTALAISSIKSLAALVVNTKPERKKL